MQIKTNGITYKLFPDKKQAVVVDVENMENLDIPAYINGCDVVSIEKRACKNKTKLKSVRIPKTVNKIKEQAFHYCWQLESVRILALNVEIYKEAFAGCGKLRHFVAYNIHLNGEFAFKDCGKLSYFSTDYKDEHSIFVGKIPSFTFYGCEHLRKLTFVNATIEGPVFSGCTNLSELEFYGPTCLTYGAEKFIKKRKIICTADSGLLDLAHMGAYIIIIE